MEFKIVNIEEIKTVNKIKKELSKIASKNKLMLQIKESEKLILFELVYFKGEKRNGNE